MKFAFIILGNFNSTQDHAAFSNEAAQIIGVSNLEEACKVAKQLQNAGVDCIELCGAFGEAGAKKIIEATNNQVAVGYVIHTPQQDELYAKLFPND